MGQTLKKLFSTHKVLWLALVIFLAGTFTLLDTGKHFSFNLEPYPDGFLYTLPAWNFTHGKTFSMEYEGSSIQNIVPPVYSWLLIPFYFLFPTPVAFYALNTILGAVTIYFLYLLVKENTSSKPSLLFVPLFAVLPAILWLPAVPMAENLLLALSTAALWLWLTKKVTLQKKVFLLLLLQLLLFFTKYASFTFIIPFNILFLWELFREKKYSHLKRYVVSAAAVFLGYVLIVQPSYLWSVFQPQQETKTGTELTAFSLSYFVQNFITYGKSLFGFPAYFLWEKIAFAAPGLVLLPVSVLLFIKKSAEQNLVIKLVFFIVSITALQSFFYAADNRYLINVLPLVFLAAALSLPLILGKKREVYSFLILGILAAGLLISQKDFYRRLIGTNWLQRSTAWQYEAVKHFESLNLPENSALITALPPYLFSFYYPDSPAILPLSSAQEFMNENQRPWGTELNYDDLIEGYRLQLEEEKILYISNAYITHQQSVITDFEQYKENFELKLVSEGCQQTCNVYRLLTR